MKHAILLYQAGIANVFAVDNASGIDNPQRIQQGTFRSCEDFTRGLQVAGVSIRVMSANVAGDATLQLNRWTTGLDDCPFRESANPPRLRNYQAANELQRVASLSAFNINGAKRRKVNQHASIYTFADGSKLRIRHGVSRADAWHPAWRGTISDIHLGPIQGMPININR